MAFINSFNDLMARGGPIMWVIFFTAWVAIILLIERTLQIYSWVSNARQDHQKLEKDIHYQPLKSGRDASPVACILKQIKWDMASNKEELAKQMNIHLAELMPKMEGMLPTIAVIGTLLPMLGLLGTVTGMIEVFEVIAIHGTGNPQQMAHGISQALLTTASGLIIAIPVIFIHHILAHRLRYLLALTEQSLLSVYSRWPGTSSLERDDEND